uniref:Uncharacterized protein n=1 Tax=Cucumis melo TaxID=3656 RepID=A0A9I9EEM1_CUCME
MFKDFWVIGGLQVPYYLDKASGSTIGTRGDSNLFKLANFASGSHLSCLTLDTDMYIFDAEIGIQKSNQITGFVRHRFVEIMALVFSHEAWRCVWHLIQSSMYITKNVCDLLILLVGLVVESLTWRFVQTSSNSKKNTLSKPRGLKWLENTNLHNLSIKRPRTQEFSWNNSPEVGVTTRWLLTGEILHSTNQLVQAVPLREII